MSDGLEASESAVDSSSQRLPHQLLRKPIALAATSNSRLSVLAAQSPFHNYPENSLPFPLNLPPSYPVFRTQSSAPLQRQLSTISSQGASVAADRPAKNPARTTTPAPVQSTARPPTVMSSASKGKRSLDAFMQSRQAAQSQTESSDSDSDTSLRKVLINRWQSLQSSESTRVLSSSPPSSSPVQTPRESSPAHPTLAGNLTGFLLSPSPRPKRQATTNARAGPSSGAPINEVPYTLPPGPYLEERPVWSLAALIGQAINASFAGALPLNDIYTYISTVYPYFDRRDQAWMSSIRHSLSVNEAFERVYDQEGTAAKRVKCKGKTRLKGGFWRLRPGFEDCFIDGNFVRKGAKGAGPGMNPSSRKRVREEDGSQRSQKAKTTGRSVHNRSSSNVETTVTGRMNSRLRSHSSPEPVSRKFSLPMSSSPPPLSASQSTYPSDSLLSDTCDSSSPAPRDYLSPQRNFRCASTNILTKLEAGFELQHSPIMNDRDKYELVHPSTTSFSPASFLSPRFSSPSPCRTPPHRPLTPSRTPISYKGMQMSPSLSLAHYKNSLEPEWKAILLPNTPVAGSSSPAPFATPQRLIFPRPFRTPSKHYDPYDPETLLADELAIAHKSHELGDSPGGIFGKEGRKLLYESPSLPGKSDWRFTHDEF